MDPLLDQAASQARQPSQPSGTSSQMTSPLTGAGDSSAIQTLPTDDGARPSNLQRTTQQQQQQQQQQATATTPQSESQSLPQQPKKRKHRGGRKRRHNRRQSFAPLPDSFPPAVVAPEREPSTAGQQQRTSPGDVVDRTGTTAAEEQHHAPFYRLGRVGAGTLSDSSLDSEALLDHRNQPMMRPRRESRLARAESFRPEYAIPSFIPLADSRHRDSRPRPNRSMSSQALDGEDTDTADDRTPLIRPTSIQNSNFVRYGGFDRRQSPTRSPHRPSTGSTDGRTARRPGRRAYSPADTTRSPGREYDVNNPPSMPGSPALGPDGGVDDPLFRELDFARTRSPEARSAISLPYDTIIDVDGSGRAAADRSPSPHTPGFASLELTRRRTVALPVEEDVCFPTGGLSDLGEEDFTAQAPTEEYTGEPRRRRRRVWPDLSVLEEWSREEKEERSGGNRAKKISEPVLIGGRLRPRYSSWKREEEDSPYRFTYFNEDLQSTVHSQTISELVQPGQTFRDLFIPDPPELEPDSESDFEEEEILHSHDATGASSRMDSTATANGVNHSGSEWNHPNPSATGDSEFNNAGINQKEKRYGPRPTFWLDVLCPTETEMRVISKAFGIHALTTEDIMMQEAREKVELFRNYYFINYRTFEQDPHSEDFLQPVNMYVIVFREGLLSFHFSRTPHSANVRRRIRQLKDYLILSSDWISYAIIDDITDVFGPLIQSIEDEVDEIDDMILRLHDENEMPASSSKENGSSILDTTSSGTNMLRRVGECRRKVISLYRLLGNKADVIKGFAKRCNEQWEVAPKSEIGLYLGDIQDHIVTMTSNLSHYENLLSRAHSNYLAQINIRMNERQEQTADVLGKLTVLGTIVLPMNIICGMWGMNVKVPGQEIDNLYWFWSITAGLMMFAVVCFYVAKRVYGIV
ncbi:hypothetical protein AJ80_05654 [Polytolypa hystricis UAMH7299]|uniref:Uncharacterized protein n=1 Tax=Polytolypa hystricis (strain UAMH7299) TaxID=1447883 RepID=A0A2B7Y2Q3_POLH7|nr:hypothetical protein AJ80_05654 [Polytolypa hystricis UAMH7299]